VPTEKLIEEVLTDPAIPISWGSNKPGMQAGKKLGKKISERCKEEWRFASEDATYRAVDLLNKGVHKEVVNRLLDPFLWQHMLISSTEWDNFFEQRISPLAQPETKALASAIKKAIRESKPKRLGFNEWHTPYVTAKEEPDVEIRKMVSVARCARVSYKPFDSKKKDIAKDLELYNKLRDAKPPHWSPFEHVATPSLFAPRGNFTGWEQERGLLS
jgi:thymidylate synthase ThyX